MALTDNINYLQPSGFRVLVDRRRFSNISFFAQSVSHPTVATNETRLPFRKFNNVPMPGDTWDYGELTINVILDEDMTSYLEIYNWMKSNIEANLEGQDGDNASYSDLVLTILSSKNNINKQIKYVDCFPTDIGNIPLEANVDGTTVITFPVTLRYTYFEFL